MNTYLDTHLIRYLDSRQALLNTTLYNRRVSMDRKPFKNTAPLIKCIPDSKGRKSLYELHDTLLQKEMKHE